jgi:lysophospholipase L1-like esterase
MAFFGLGIWGLTHNKLYEQLWRRLTQAPYTPSWENEVDKHQNLYTEPMNVVMLGNSITFEANWNELLGRTDVANRGIPGDVTQAMLVRLGTVLQLKPKIIFLEAGINDILSGYDIEKTKSNYQQLVENILIKGITPVVTLTFYTRYEPESNADVDELNAFLKEFCAKNNVPTIDLSSEFNEDGRLSKEVTHDGVHLNTKGYKLWAEKVKEVLLKLEEEKSQ